MTPQIPAVMGSSHIPPTGSLSLLVFFFFFPPPPCPDSAFQHGQWLRHQPKSLSWNTLTCHMCHCNWMWGFPGLTGYFQRLSYIKWNLSSSVPPHIRPFWILFFLLFINNIQHFLLSFASVFLATANKNKQKSNWVSYDEGSEFYKWCILLFNLEDSLDNIYCYCYDMVKALLTIFHPVCKIERFYLQNMAGSEI